MLGYLSLDIICSSKLTVFLELRSGKSVSFLEQIMSAENIRASASYSKDVIYREKQLTITKIINELLALFSSKSITKHLQSWNTVIKLANVKFS